MFSSKTSCIIQWLLNNILQNIVGSHTSSVQASSGETTVTEIDYAANHWLQKTGVDVPTALTLLDI
jgi:hypothetical protein